MFKTQYNSKDIKVRGEISFRPSKTIPDQSLSVKEIFRRFANGLPLQGQKIPVYDGDEDQPDFRRMDLAEIEDFKNNARAEIDEIKTKHQKKPKKDPQALGKIPTEDPQSPTA